MTSAEGKSTPQRLRRWVLITSLAWASYVLLAALFLNTPLADTAFNRHPDRFALHWRVALSLYPGHVMAWGIDVQGHVRRNQWQASASRAQGRIALLPLFKRELQMPAIHASDVVFAGKRVDEDMPPRPAGTNGWTIHLPRIDSDSLHEARWEKWVLRGQSSARFGMRKVLRGGAMEVLPSSLNTHDAQLLREGQILLDTVSSEAHFALAEHLSSDYPGLAKLDLVDARLSILEARTTGLVLRPEAGEAERFSLSPGDGSLRADLRYARGLLQNGNVHLELPVRSEFANGTGHDNRLSVSLDVDDGLQLTASLPPHADNPLRLAADLHIAQQRIDPTALRELLPQTSGTLDLRWRFDSLAWLSSTLVRGDWLAFDGHGELDAKLRIEQGRLQPGSRFEVPEAILAVRTLDNRISGNAQASGHIEGDADAPTVRIDFVAERFAAAPDAHPDKPYVHGHNLRVELNAAGDLERFRDDVKARLRFSEATIPDLTHYNHYLPRRNLRFLSGQGTLSGDLNLDGSGRISQGRIDLRARGASLRVADLSLRSDVWVAGRLADTELDSRRMKLDGTQIELRHASFSDRSGRQQQGWWARIDLPKAHARWKRPLALDGEADIAMKDIGFLLALFERKKRFPRWITGLIDAGPTRVKGVAQLRGRHLVLDRLVAQNERFGMKARLRLQDAQLHGDVLMNWKALALGVELAPDDRDYRFIRPRQWYDERPDLLPNKAP